MKELPLAVKIAFLMAMGLSTAVMLGAALFSWALVAALLVRAPISVAIATSIFLGLCVWIGLRTGRRWRQHILRRTKGLEGN